MEPQPYRCGGTACNPGTGFTVMLQWSRTFIVAESFLYGILVENASALQWGRNFIVAEIWPGRGSSDGSLPCFNGAATLSLRKSGSGDYPVTDTHPLQWGRNFIVAEMRMACRLLLCYPCFNGAATLSLWKCVLVTTTNPRHASGFNGAATLSLRKSCCCWCGGIRSYQASMEPQLYRCGNRTRPAPSEPFRPCFNGAATLSLRKWKGESH